ncbi:hypothetical protein [Nonomuraea salmonea]|uniref:hypothetical protein n=1 Tax=Nonomuraea salmonea TaxID=46181 RepID=UPI003CD05D6B
MLPPRILRRVVLAPLVIVVTVFMLVTLPFWLVVTAAASLRLPPPQRRGARFVWFAVAWLTLESAVLIACLWLWVAGGAKRQERHYALIGWFLTRVYGAAERIFLLTTDIEEPEPTPRGAGGQALPAGHRPVQARGPRRLLPADPPPAGPLPPAAPHRHEGRAPVRPVARRRRQPAAERVRAPQHRPERRHRGDPPPRRHDGRQGRAGDLPRGRELHPPAAAASPSGGLRRRA